MIPDEEYTLGRCGDLIDRKFSACVKFPVIDGNVLQWPDGSIQFVTPDQVELIKLGWAKAKGMIK